MKEIKYIIISMLFLFIAKINNAQNNSNTIKELRFIGEQIIPAHTEFKNTKVGGLSSIDYANGKFYLISDDKGKPVRFYKMQLNYNKDSFSEIKINKVINIETDEEFIDSESLRFDKFNNSFFWTSEGNYKKGVSPKIFEINAEGKEIKTHKTPNIFQAKNNTKTIGTRRNGTFEALSMSINPYVYWVGMELPLKQDGEEPKIEKGNYPIRISKIDKKTDELKYQFVYNLDEIPKNSIPKNKFIVNGCPEILELDSTNFLVLERAYASGHKDGGNTVKIYITDFSKATDVRNIQSLKNHKYTSAKKTLLFNFETIRNKLTNGIVDNVEGITFGKVLENGNQTIVVVSDNNFNKFNPQLNQFIVFEIIK